MQRFEGQQVFRQPPAQLWEKLSDAGFLVQCIPDVESVREQSSERAVIVVRPGLSFVRGSLDAVIERVEALAPERVVWDVVSRGIGSSSAVRAVLEIVPEQAGSRVIWVIEVRSLGGLLKLVPAGLIQGAAQKVVGDAWAALAARLEAAGGESGTP
jgi:carbon monoxide dehydrogenase subunit G